jgi:N-acetylneuraminic acid mutarotase
MITARQSHTAVILTNGKVMATGGFNSSYLLSAELYNPSLNQWTSAGAMTTTKGLNYSTSILSNGRILVVGGNNLLSDLATVDVYFP